MVERSRYASPLKTKGTASFVIATNVSSRIIRTNADYITDGIDDNIQIQAALTEVAAAGGGQVYLMAGTYSISAKMTIDDGVWLCGEGNQTILTLASGVNDSLLQNTTRSAGGDSNIKISDIRFDGNKSNNTTTGTTDGVVDMMQVSNLVIQNVEIVEADMVALEISTCDTVNVSRCYIATADKDGIAVNLSCYDVVIANNIIYNCGHVNSANNAAIEIQDGCYNIVVSGNAINSCAFGIEVSAHVSASDGLPNYNVQIIGNSVVDTIRGIGLTATNAEEISYNISVIGNTVTDTTDGDARHCLLVDSLDSSIIENNIFSNWRRGVEFRTVLSDIIFSNNTVKSLAASTDAYTGVKFLANSLDVDRFLFSNNIIEGYGYEALFIDGGTIDDLLITGNIFANYDVVGGTGRAITIDGGTYNRIVLSDNYFDTTPHTIRDNGGSAYEELPDGWRCLQPELYNKRTITAASANIGADETGKMFYIDTGSNAVTVTLPDAVVGLEFTFFLTDATTAQSLRIEPDTGDTIALANGVQEAVNDYITNATGEAVGDGCRLKCRLAGRWEHFDSVGTWTGE